MLQSLYGAVTVRDFILIELQQKKRVQLMK
jgi:hypothetical protein